MNIYAAVLHSIDFIRCIALIIIIIIIKKKATSSD